ncbi:MAG: tripartite tricarboxylate transporter substrate binding protein [Betaproteobacteria bacterium]|nr:tripartite tricarboxylate transporter substrate binding protein [Betaproteobacteria bacterium]
MKVRTNRLLAAALALAPVGFAVAHAQTYPDRPIRMIVPFAPGGGTDIVSRLVAQRLADSIKQSIVVDNRAGGAGNIGAELVARASPDGYTLLVGSATILAVNPVIFKVSYNPSRDFAPITLLGSQPHLMVVHPSVPANSVREFVALAKEKSLKLNYGSSGTGGPAHLGGELFKIVAGIDMLHIPYKGTGPAVIDLVGGQLQVGLLSLASSMPHVKTGRLRALAVTSPKRAVVAPELPTIAESGYPGFEVRSWYGLLAPAGTPKAIIDKLSSQIASVLRQPEVIAKLAGDGAEPGGDTPAEFAAYIKNEAERWGKVVKTAGIRAD